MYSNLRKKTVTKHPDHDTIVALNRNSKPVNFTAQEVRRKILSSQLTDGNSGSRPKQDDSRLKHVGHSLLKYHGDHLPDAEKIEQHGVEASPEDTNQSMIRCKFDILKSLVNTFKSQLCKTLLLAIETIK